jgi:hypothetical protein
VLALTGLGWDFQMTPQNAHQWTQSLIVFVLAGSFSVALLEIDSLSVGTMGGDPQELGALGIVAGIFALVLGFRYAYLIIVAVVNLF